MLSGLKASKEYRHAFVDEAIRTRITAQIKALRDEREINYKQFAEQIDEKPSWVYHLEDPNVAGRPPFRLSCESPRHSILAWTFASVPFLNFWTTSLR